MRARVNRIMAALGDALPPERGYCSSHLLCRPTAILTSALALVEHDTMVKGLKRDSAEELGQLVDTKRYTTPDWYISDWSSLRTLRLSP